jgi:hypothetical protein
MNFRETPGKIRRVGMSVLLYYMLSAAGKVFLLACCLQIMIYLTREHFFLTKIYVTVLIYQLIKYVLC